ncbi:transposase [Xenorhabdus vietnamensis]|uniref:Transposase n=1 Tax=Xenorhabdus vietnamensis TaxID=351656 RepID=A0A1Y2S8Z0_9GAMM|nr:transposase [Xenorhabdus vietnamensis]
MSETPLFSGASAALLNRAGYQSVFDIIRQARTAFVQSLPEIQEAELQEIYREARQRAKNRFCRIKAKLAKISAGLIMSLIQKTFQRLHYPTDIMAQCILWYLAYALSLRNLEEMMAKRGINVDHSTLHRWVTQLVPLLDKAFRRHKRPVGRRWRMDETDIKVKGQWKYLYRAVDTADQTIDFLLTAKRDTAAALRFFRKAIHHQGKPEEETIAIRQSKYLNNLIEQDHRNIKRRTRSMLGFKSFRRAQTRLAGIEIISM